ncbi:MAG: NosD domain-containing protein [Candidatus Cloacimonas sp.]|jgi:parallel beta-helix repeat protein|nr:NosD domain-containing protein [Candidatus Cloacimonas sp.]
MKQGKIVAIVFMFIMLMVTQKLMAVYPLTRTYSVNPDSLHQIRAAAGLVVGEASDALITRYWETYTRTYRDEIPDPNDVQRDRSYTDSFGFEPQAIKAYTAVLNYENNSPQYSDDLDDIRNYLFTFPWEIYQNALRDSCYYPRFEPIPSPVPTEWDNEPQNDVTGEDEAWWQLTDYQRAREMSYNLILMSYLVDMLYYAHDRSDTTATAYTQFESILTNLNAHMIWIHTTFFNYGLPNSPANGWNNTGWNIYDLFVDWDNTGWNIYDLFVDGDSSITAPLGMCADNNGSGGGVYLPELANSVSRFHLICGLGYASILTGQDTFLNTFVKNEFKSSSSIPADTPYYGFNDYLTTNSGMFIGGLTYQNRFFYMSNLFLTALKRTKGINLYNSANDWNCDMIPRMVRYTLRRIDPELHHITFGDDWRYNGIQSNGVINPAMNHSIQIERGLLSFYYQNTDDPESRDNIRWYVSALKNSANNTSGDWPREIYEHDFASSFETVMNYQATTHGGPASVTTGGSLPSYISQGTYSNSESTILRSPTSSFSGYSASHMLVVNHENSFVPYHNNDDNTAFQFYLWGKPVIVEPGYVPYILGEAKYWDWYRSSFSQNLLLINPASPVREGKIDETEYLKKPADLVANFSLKYEDPMNFHSWPISWLTRIQETRPYYNKASKQFLLRNINSSGNDDTEHLRIHFEYNNSMSSAFEPTPANIGYDNEDNPCHVFRNFYKVSDKYFIVLDKAIFEETQSSNNEFRNQMNLLTQVRNSSGLFTASIRSFPDDGLPGVYQYTMTGPKNMFIAMGSSIAGVNSYSVSDPDSTKLAWTPHDWSSQGGIRIGSMQRLSITASSTNNQERFITLLYPSVNSDSYNPVTEAIHDNSGYRLAITEGIRKVFVSLCSGSTLVYPDEDYRFGTDGDFFVVDAEPDFSSIHDMILSNGSALTASPNVGSSFPAQDLFKSFSDGLDEVIASWKDGGLHVTFRTNQALYPKYKIRRCEVLPSQFFSKTEYGVEIHTVIDTTSSSRGTIADNVNTLAYDNQYFYVNYTWNDLSAAGLIDDNLVLVKATIPELNLNTDINIQGVVSIIGSITINNGASMEIYPNSSVTISGGVDISNHGTLTIDGGDSRSITLSNAGQPWKCITTYQEGTLICHNAIIAGASTGIQIRGTATITDNEIRDCRHGISIEKATPFTVIGNLIKQNTYGVMVSNNYSSSNTCFIEGNEVTQNGLGIVLYNSNTKIAQNDIHANTRGGLYLTRGSEPIVKDNNISFSESTTSTRPEITLESDSYPIIDDSRNDINADGLGYSLYYAFYTPTNKIKTLIARNNYWGSTDTHLIRNSIYPHLWDVVYEPFSMEPNTFFPHLGDNLFKQALAAEDSGEISLAKQLYSSIVATEPDSLYALQSLGRLTSIYSGSPSLLSELRCIYNIYTATCSDSILVKSAQIKNVMIDRFDGMYLQALQGYEDQLNLSATELDSLLCQLDITYTLQDMYYDDQAKGACTGMSYQSNGINITSIAEARLSIDRLWGKILEETENEDMNNAPVPTKFDVMNYPNPFNPSTTIAFSLPEEGVVRLSVYNIRGQKVRDLMNGSIDRGFHTVVWDGKDNGNCTVSSGLYFVRIDTGNRSVVKKIMMLK